MRWLTGRERGEWRVREVREVEGGRWEVVTEWRPGRGKRWRPAARVTVPVTVVEELVGAGVVELGVVGVVGRLGCGR